MDAPWSSRSSMWSKNETTCLASLYDLPLCYQSSYSPFYYSDKLALIEGVSDSHLTVAAPVVAYWVLSLFFHFLDTRTWKSLEKYRIHPSAEVSARNLASRSSVVWAVLGQHVIQTILGLWWLADEPPVVVDHSAPIQQLASRLWPFARFIGLVDPIALLQVAEFIYWWAVPAAQLLVAMFFLDTWQYFLHRLMHVNKFLYKHFHSWHHRLYVPYAFGSLYNHPIEGFVLDTLGSLIAEALTGMTTRQAMFLFSVSTLKTVDDHCGYNFPWDPLQMITTNNADYHDIHHQVIGIKSNFAQPFFVHWDTLLGTRLTREDIQARREGRKGKEE